MLALAGSYGLALCCPMLAEVLPLCLTYFAMLTLFWPKLALSCPYVDPIFPQVGPMLA